MTVPETMLFGRLILKLIILILIVRMSTGATTARNGKEVRYQYVPQPQGEADLDLGEILDPCPDYPPQPQESQVSVWGLFTALIVASTVVGNLVHISNSNNDNNNNNNNLDNQNSVNQNGNMAENQNTNMNMIMGRSSKTGGALTRMLSKIFVCRASRDTLNYSGIEQVLRKTLLATAASMMEGRLHLGNGELKNLTADKKNCQIILDNFYL